MTEILEITIGGQKSKCAYPYKSWLECCEMVKGFQISSHDLTRITFNPPFGQKLSKWLTRDFCQFLSKSGQMLSDLNSETRFEIFLSFHNFLNLICEDFHILIFWLP